MIASAGTMKGNRIAQSEGSDQSRYRTFPEGRGHECSKIAGVFLEGIDEGGGANIERFCRDREW